MTSAPPESVDIPIYIPFPKALYNEIILRFDGAVDPTELITRQARHLLRCKAVPFSLPENLSPGWRLSLLQDLENRVAGHNWEEVFMLNGTKLLLPWRGHCHQARVYDTRIRASGWLFDTVRDWFIFITDADDKDEWKHIQLKRPNKDEDFCHAAQVRQQIVTEPRRIGDITNRSPD
ncbi:hypothetical protein ELI16_14465 [Rhizobium ruizarguesonis]|uniref:hypothetical protein n=1 Tax=Rhizobium ruizarguesonis TaxID=2081791 RepID=UPI00102FFAF9|nr:hypothetical protein [Rhizobium ruizarguesonis]TAW73056.1 hypothetical protein ELI16_14465 [Rhizobium ruizarguesonis]